VGQLLASRRRYGRVIGGMSSEYTSSERRLCLSRPCSWLQSTVSQAVCEGNQLSRWNSISSPTCGRALVLQPRWPPNRKMRQRPTLPHSLPCSTIGAGGLNDRVRNGNGCGPSAIATAISRTSGTETRRYIFSCTSGSSGTETRRYTDPALRPFPPPQTPLQGKEPIR
jgi:hypothetical protein